MALNNSDPSLEKSKIGVITTASLTEGAEMKLVADMDPELIKAGKFLVIDGRTFDFFCIITDLRLATTNPDTSQNPPDFTTPLIKKVVSGTTTYTLVSLKPMLLYHKEKKELELVKTIPAHFTEVFEASDEDIKTVFGSESLNKENDRKYFWVGSPLDMHQPVCLDLERLAERSSSVFGRTGTGKTFITRLLLAGFIHTNAAVNLVFDVHNEYGTKGTNEGGAGVVKGLQPLFSNTGKIKVYSLDPEGTKNRGAHCDKELKIGIDSIEPEDILLLQEELRLNPTAAECTNILKQVFRDTWLKEFLDLMESKDSDQINEFAETNRLLVNSMDALYRRLLKLKQLNFLDFNPHQDKMKIINDLINDLQKGISVVVEFGKYESMLAYLLVANIITRQVERSYKEKTETYLRNGSKPIDKPKQLVITVEEAHKFLNTRAVSQTSFGKIARELRKYFVSLLIVDQRPSGIDDEVLSQIGTKIIAALSDEKDINAVLSGVSNSGGIKNIIISLDTKQQVLVLGHGTPMPVVIKTRDYDEKFYSAIGTNPTKERLEEIKESKSRLFPST